LIPFFFNLSFRVFSPEENSQLRVRKELFKSDIFYKKNGVESKKKPGGQKS
jgi:hypothetical protein